MGGRPRCMVSFPLLVSSFSGIGFCLRMCMSFFRGDLAHTDAMLVGGRPRCMVSFPLLVSSFSGIGFCLRMCMSFLGGRPRCMVSFPFAGVVLFWYWVLLAHVHEFLQRRFGFRTHHTQMPCWWEEGPGVWFRFLCWCRPFLVLGFACECA